MAPYSITNNSLTETTFYDPLVDRFIRSKLSNPRGPKIQDLDQWESSMALSCNTVPTLEKCFRTCRTKSEVQSV